MTHPHTSQRPATGFHWGKRIAVVYSAFAIATLSFVAFALTQSVDLVRQDYYEHALLYDSTAQARQRSRNATAFHSIITQSNGSIEIRLPHSVETGEVYCYRPNNPAMDSVIALKPDDNLVQVLAPGVLAPGAWRITVRWKHEGADYEHSQMVMVWNH